MSSFIGHSVAAITVYVATESVNSSMPISDRLKHIWQNKKQFIWLLWLIIVASVPDLDYVVKAWQSSNNQGLRITHSVLFSLIVPSLTIAVLFILKVKSKKLWLFSIQVVLAGLSHLLLDLLVGVTPLPILFPAINIPFKLPFGILPSAGKIDFNNYYFYRNLKLEMGVLLPIFGLVCLLGDCEASRRHRSTNKLRYRQIRFLFKLLACGILLVCCLYFINLNLALPR